MQTNTQTQKPNKQTHKQITQNNTKQTNTRNQIKQTHRQIIKYVTTQTNKHTTKHTSTKTK